MKVFRHLSFQLVAEMNNFFLRQQTKHTKTHPLHTTIPNNSLSFCYFLYRICCRASSKYKNTQKSNGFSFLLNTVKHQNQPHMSDIDEAVPIELVNDMCMKTWGLAQTSLWGSIIFVKRSCNKLGSLWHRLHHMNEWPDVQHFI